MKDRLRLLERRDIDELIILDIAATPEGRGPRFAEVSELCAGMFCPVTVGGGVRSLDDIRELLRCGADKVAICSAIDPYGALIGDAAKIFGSQALVAVIDVKSHAGHINKIPHSHCGTIPLFINTEHMAVMLEEWGAGEILLTDVDRDGTMTGYNLDLIRSVSSAVDIPVIAAGGCGSYEHMRQAIEAGAHAVASGAMFQFCEATPKGAARYLNEHRIPARL